MAGGAEGEIAVDTMKVRNLAAGLWRAAWRSLGFQVSFYRGTSLIRNNPPLGPCSRTMPRALRWSWGGGQFLVSEVTL